MARYVEIRLEKRGVSSVARLLDDAAPTTCDLVWEALPQSSDAFHAKNVGDEVYCLVPPFGPPGGPGLENSTIVPSAGDVGFFYFRYPKAQVSPWIRHELQYEELAAIIDLALFYGSNNLLCPPTEGFVPTNVFARVEENLEAMADACQDVWRTGSQGERLTFRRLPEEPEPDRHER